MKISLISVGEVKNKNTLQMEAEYIKRLAPYFKTKIVDIPTRKYSSLSGPERKISEAGAFKSKISEGDYLVLMDEKGQQFTTAKFATFIKKHMMGGTKNMVFGIGGVYGWDESFKKNAGILLSLSPFTFTYELSRLILIEQIYRANTIIHGIPYHKE